MTMSGEIRFAVVDDHPMFRAGVIATLARAGLTCVAEGATPEEAVRLAGERAPDVILLDIDRAGGSLSAVRAIAAGSPGVRLLLLAEAPDQEQVVAALRAGASGYAPKSLTGVELVESVRWVGRGDTYVYPTLAAAVISQASARKPHDPFAMLSVREEQILRYLAKGFSNKQIGHQLEISDKTVKHYLTSLMQKLQVRNRVEAALLAAKRAPADTHANRAN
jgi:DNA-binding NarL/FixJ family response regulator